MPFAHLIASCISDNFRLSFVGVLRMNDYATRFEPTTYGSCGSRSNCLSQSTPQGANGRRRCSLSTTSLQEHCFGFAVRSFFVIVIFARL